MRGVWIAALLILSAITPFANAFETEKDRVLNTGAPLSDDVENAPITYGFSPAVRAAFARVSDLSQYSEAELASAKQWVAVSQTPLGERTQDLSNTWIVEVNPELAPEIFSQFPLVEALIEAAGFKTFPMVEFEADDALASLAYIAREDSIIHNVSVYQARLKMGEYLANKIKNEIDLTQIDYVVPIPTTSKPVALRMSEVLQIPYRECIVKNRYIARTFIMNNQKTRNLNIQRKLSVVTNIYL